ncbi:MAG: 18 kDa heat shock protein [Candidatus Xenolissoclinum pacificiensis L6]|uniref:18 kDa heat shock protein n=1 Tax=Candidatus Xenolissoclinum pacificiensis L6 TaxID=1401685 RepID=W2V1R2_9RICK|nr:MAG: 18 kDa heat shock protein [Candidatus Xenolissoclinum pacificiensis L6]
MNTLSRNNNNHQVRTLKSGFDSLFDNFFDNFDVSFDNTTSKLKVNIAEDDQNYYVDAELPGITKENVSIDHTNDILTIRAEKKEEKKESNKIYHRLETSYGIFTRSVQVSNVDYNNIKAQFQDGILKITLPKKENNTTKITIE